MTICIHLSGAGSIVTATDTQKTGGSDKVDAGKIISFWRANPSGAINIAGAGDVLYINGLAQEIKHGFENFKGTFAELEPEIKRITQDFYTTHVLPHEGLLEDDNLPDYALLVGASHQGQRALWNIENTLATEVSMFDCIGIGDGMAEPMLGKLWPEYPTLDSLAVLAAYTIWRVKSSIDGCGLKTEIRFIYQEKPGIVPMDRIRQWEACFEKYDQLERHLFHHAMGYQVELAVPPQIQAKLPNLPKLPPPDTKSLPEIVKEVEALRDKLSRLTILSPTK